MLQTGTVTEPNKAISSGGWPPHQHSNNASVVQSFLHSPPAAHAGSRTPTSTQNPKFSAETPGFFFRFLFSLCLPEVIHSENKDGAKCVSQEWSVTCLLAEKRPTSPWKWWKATTTLQDLKEEASNSRLVAHFLYTTSQYNENLTPCC